MNTNWLGKTILRLKDGDGCGECYFARTPCFKRAHLVAVFASIEDWDPLCPLLKRNPDIEPLCTPAGDVNGDGVVNILDLVFVANQF